MGRIIYRDTYAYDLDIKILSSSEIFDKSVINQSIESILSTFHGERLFNLSFGSILPKLLFENMSDEYAEEIIDSLVGDIKTWEDRITIIEQNISLEVLHSENTLILIIPYIINENKITSTFKRKIIF